MGGGEQKCYPMLHPMVSLTQVCKEIYSKKMLKVRRIRANSKAFASGPECHVKTRGCRVGSGHEALQISRVDSGRVKYHGSGRVTRTGSDLREGVRPVKSPGKFRRLWVKEPRRSQNVSVQNVVLYLYRSMRYYPRPMLRIVLLVLTVR